MDIEEKLISFKRLNDNKTVNVNFEKFDEHKYDFIQVKEFMIEKKEDKPLAECIYETMLNFCQALTQRTEPFTYSVVGDKVYNELKVILGGYRVKDNFGEKLNAFSQNVNYEHIKYGRNDTNLKYQGLISGVPDIESIDNSIDALIKAMANRNFVLNVAAKPLNIKDILNIKRNILNEKNRNYENIKKNISTGKTDTEGNSSREGKSYNNNSGAAFVVSTQESQGESYDNTQNYSTTVTENTTIEKISSAEQEYDELLQTHLDRIIKAESNGLWETTICISAETEEELNLALDVFAAPYKNNGVEAFKILKPNKSFEPLSIIKRNTLSNLNQEKHLIYEGRDLYFNLLTAEELALFIRLPEKSYNGYKVLSVPRFSQESVKCKNGIEMAYICDSSIETNIPFYLNQEQLSKHVFIAGITGSGKTNTVFSILQNINIPFLVIEPAKTEYRCLKSVIKDARIYCLGQEQVSPFRLNPFKFYKDISLQQHIDNLKVIFTAAFTMYASMPNILEQCLNNIYIKKGWSIITSENIYAKESISDEFYPTMEDLYHEIDNYIENLGYAKEQTQNIKAALLTRIKSLMTGGKGFMLNTSMSIDTKELLRYPTILELDGIADDEEKSLIIGFIMMNIYEYLKSSVKGYSNELKHLIVMEEAHRLFANVSSSQNQEVVNIRGKSVETLSNILCEIRAYGEGMLIVDQVPVKLAADVLKNTNTKIIHRLVSKDDCDYVSNSLNMDDEKVKYLNRLKTGTAIVYNEDMEEPAHIKIKINKDKLAYVSNDEVRIFSKEYNTFTDNIKVIHPLVDLMFQNKSILEKLLNVGKKLYSDILNEPINNLSNAYNERLEKLTNIALENSFDIYEHKDTYLDSIVCETINYIINSDKDLSNNIRRKVYIKRLMSSAVDILKLNYDENEKIYKLLDVSRKNII